MSRAYCEIGTIKTSSPHNKSYRVLVGEFQPVFMSASRLFLLSYQPHRVPVLAAVQQTKVFSAGIS